MKKKLVALLAVLSTVCALGACAFDGAVSFDESSNNGGSVSESESTSESTSDSSSDGSSDSDSSSSGSEADKHLYTEFTATESAIFASS